MKTVFILLVIVAMSINTFAQSPQKMSYQAVIRDANSALITSHIVGMRISILMGSINGTAVYTETQTPTTNANGLVSIEIGGKVGFDVINWRDGSYYLKTETDPTGGTNYTISGTSQLLSVPYALHAKTADNGFSGNYNDLINKPLLFDGTWTNIIGKPATLTGFEITDAMSTAHPANGINSGMISNWNTAFSWANHAGLYRPISYVPAWSEITGKPTSIADYGIVDAVTITGDQTVAGIKTFSNDLLINLLTIGKGNGSIASNLAIGYQALYSNTSGAGNTANGFMALWSNTTGSGNTAYGFQALDMNATGKENTAVGYHALNANTTGDFNSANGYQSLNSNTTGIENTAIGYKALYSNRTGNYNTATGYQALYSNTIRDNITPTGSSNTANGYQALFSNTLGFENTAIGYQALYSNIGGTDNTAIGKEALYRNYDAHGNTAVGFASLAYNETGGYNTAIGASALNNNVDGYANAATGSGSLHSNSNGYKNTANGREALISNTTGNNNVAVGESSGTTNIIGSYNILIGSQADVATGGLTNAVALGYNAKVNANNKVRIGNSSVTVIEGQVNWSVGSDSRLKDNIQYSDKLGLEFINGLKPVTFIYKNDPTKSHHDGLIAQDVKEVLEQLGLSFSGFIESDNEEKTLNLAYAEFVVPLINAIQEQQKQIEELKDQIKSLMKN